MKKLILFIITIILMNTLVLAATIDSVSYNVGEIQEGQQVELEITFQGTVNGELKLTQEGELIIKKQVTGPTTLEFEVPAPVPTADGDDMYDWQLKYYENGEQKDKKELGQFWGSLIIVENGKEGYQQIVPTPKIPIESKWGSIDFRVLTSNKESEQPVEIVINNKLNKEINAKIEMNSIYLTGEKGTTKSFNWELKPGQNNKQVEFNVKTSEGKNDIEIIAEYEGKKISDLQNTLIRLKPDYIKEGKLPPRPGEILNQEMVKMEQELFTKEKTNPLNIIAGIIAAIMIIILIIVGIYFYRR